MFFLLPFSSSLLGTSLPFPLATFRLYMLLIQVQSKSNCIYELFAFWKARNLMASKAILALTLLLAYFRLFFDGGFSSFIMGILCMYMYMYCTVCVSIYDSVYVNNFYALHKYACVFYDPPCLTVRLSRQSNQFLLRVCSGGGKTVGEGRPFWKALLSNQIQKE